MTCYVLRAHARERTFLTICGGLFLHLVVCFVDLWCRIVSWSFLMWFPNHVSEFSMQTEKTTTTITNWWLWWSMSTTTNSRPPIRGSLDGSRQLPLQFVMEFGHDVVMQDQNDSETNSNGQVEMQQDVINNQARQDNMLAYNPLHVMSPNQITPRET